MDFSQILPAVLSIGIIGAILGAVLAFASKVFHVPVDPKVEQIGEILPQANCGACGYPGCAGYAEAVASGKAETNLCSPGGADVVSAIATIMGVEATAAEPMVAYAACNGGKSIGNKFEYYGPKSCADAVFVSGGQKPCDYGCMGFGDCVTACKFDAIYIDSETELPVVDDEKCVGCEACVLACPKAVMKMIPKKSNVYIACNSQDKGKDVMDVCKVGCIACKMCTLPKITPSKAIKMDGNLPVIDFSVHDELQPAKYKCPKSCFVDKGDRTKTAEQVAKEKADFKAVEAEKAAAAKKILIEKAAAAKKAKEEAAAKGM